MEVYVVEKSEPAELPEIKKRYIAPLKAFEQEMPYSEPKSYINGKKNYRKRF